MDNYNVAAQIITTTIFGVPYYNDSINGSQNPILIMEALVVDEGYLYTCIHTSFLIECSKTKGKKIENQRNEEKLRLIRPAAVQGRLLNSRAP